VTQSALKPLALILVSLLISCAAPSVAGAVKSVQSVLSPPDHYLRQIVIEVRDPTGQPVEGARLELTPILGQVLAKTKGLQTNNQGQVRFNVKPVIEEPMAGRRIKDRFIFYKSACKYKLVKPGFISQEDEIKDVQEFAAFRDPLYRALDREPARGPLVRSVTLYPYQGFLVSDQNVESRSEYGHKRLEDLVEALIKRGEKQNFSLPLASIAFPTGPAAVFKLRLIFGPHFDSTELGLLGAGAVLFRGPFLTALSVISDFLPPADSVKVVRIDILTHFQSRTDTRTRPVQQVFTFRLPAAQISSFLEQGKTSPFPLDALTIEVNGQTLDLSKELNQAAGAGSPDNSL